MAIGCGGKEGDDQGIPEERGRSVSWLFPVRVPANNPNANNASAVRPSNTNRPPLQTWFQRILNMEEVPADQSVPRVNNDPILRTLNPIDQENIQRGVGILPRARLPFPVSYIKRRTRNIPRNSETEFLSSFGFDAKNLDLKEACDVMADFDFDEDYDLIKKTILSYSLRFYGIPECPERDLPLAVFFFIDEHFSFQPELDLCIRGLPDDEDPNVIGVVFRRRTMASKIMKNKSKLNNTNYRVTTNQELLWIVDNLHFDDEAI